MKLIKLQSKSDISCALSESERFSQAIDTKDHVQVDCSGVELLGAPIAQLLVAMQKALLGGGGVMELRNLTEVVREDLSALGMLQHFTLVD